MKAPWETFNVAWNLSLMLIWFAAGETAFGLLFLCVALNAMQARCNQLLAERWEQIALGQAAIINRMMKQRSASGPFADERGIA